MNKRNQNQIFSWFDQVYGHVDPHLGIPFIILMNANEIKYDETWNECDMIALYANFQQACNGDYSEREYNKSSESFEPLQRSKKRSNMLSLWLKRIIMSETNTRNDNDTITGGNNNESMDDARGNNNNQYHKLRIIGKETYRSLQGTSEELAKIEYLYLLVNGILSDAFMHHIKTYGNTSDNNNNNNNNNNDNDDELSFWTQWLKSNADPIRNTHSQISHSNRATTGAVTMMKSDDDHSMWMQQSFKQLSSSSSSSLSQKSKTIDKRQEISLSSDIIARYDESDWNTLTPLRFLSEQQESRLEAQLHGEEALVKQENENRQKMEDNNTTSIRMGDLSEQCDKMSLSIAQEIRLLKFSLRESMRRVTELEHLIVSNDTTKYYPNDNDGVIITREQIERYTHAFLASHIHCSNQLLKTEKTISTGGDGGDDGDGMDDVQDVRNILSNIGEQYVLLDRKMQYTNTLIHNEMKRRGIVHVVDTIDNGTISTASTISTAHSNTIHLKDSIEEKRESTICSSSSTTTTTSSSSSSLVNNWDVMIGFLSTLLALGLTIKCSTIG
jgi:hypothetical protein